MKKKQKQLLEEYFRDQGKDFPLKKKPLTEQQKRQQVLDQKMRQSVNSNRGSDYAMQRFLQYMERKKGD